MYSILPQILFFFSILLFGLSEMGIAQPMAIIRGDNVNIRNGAGINHQQLFQLNTGDSCQVVFNMREENILSYNGIALFMSSANTETSIEIPQLGQGLFTYFYIQGLKGEADIDNNKIVTLQELYEYVQFSVNYIAWTKFKHHQTPKISGYFDTEMPVGIVR